MGEGTFILLDELDGRDETYAKIETILQPSDSIEAVRKDLVKTFETLGESDFVESAYFEL